MFDAVQGFDARLRARNEREAAARAAQIERGFLEDINTRLGGSNAQSAQQKVRSLLERHDGGETYGPSQEQLALLLGDRSDPRAQMLLNSAAVEAARRNPLVQMQRTLSQTDPGSRAQQVLAYGGLAGGATAGLTAAGQGLMALMEYLQQGSETQAERDQSL